VSERPIGADALETDALGADACSEPTAANRGLEGPARRRSPRTDAAIAAAVQAILVDVGYAGLTMEGVAAHAHVSKAALYRRWPGKAEMVADVLGNQDLTSVEFPDTGSTRQDLLGFTRSLARTLVEPTGAVLTSLLSEMARNDELAAAFRARAAPPLFARFQELVRRGVRRGDLRPSVDPAVLGNLLVGPLFHRVLVDGGLLDDDLVARYVNLVLDGVAAP